MLIKKNYMLQRSLVNLAHRHYMKPFYKTWDHEIYFNDHKIPVRIFSPEVIGDYPILLFFHGGGWVTGNIDSYDKVCTNMARLTNHIVVSVDYRLAPEHRFPAALEDCYQVARALFLDEHIAYLPSTLQRSVEQNVNVWVCKGVECAHSVNNLHDLKRLI